MCNITHTRKKYKKQNEFHLLLSRGTLRPEMFAVKNMDSLLRLKLDMVYRGLPLEEAQTRYTELTNPKPAEEPASAPAPAPAVVVGTAPKPKRVVKRVKPATGKST